MCEDNLTPYMNKWREIENTLQAFSRLKYTIAQTSWNFAIMF